MGTKKTAAVDGSGSVELLLNRDFYCYEMTLTDVLQILHLRYVFPSDASNGKGLKTIFQRDMLDINQDVLELKSGFCPKSVLHVID